MCVCPRPSNLLSPFSVTCTDMSRSDHLELDNLCGRWFLKETDTPTHQSLTRHCPPAAFHLGAGPCGISPVPVPVGMSTGAAILLPCSGDHREFMDAVSLSCMEHFVCPRLGYLLKGLVSSSCSPGVEAEAALNSLAFSLTSPTFFSPQ